MYDYLKGIGEKINLVKKWLEGKGDEMGSKSSQRSRESEASLVAAWIRLSWLGHGVWVGSRSGWKGSTSIVEHKPHTLAYVIRGRAPPASLS